MSEEGVSKDLQWRLHLKSPPSEVYQMWATDDGRAKFWAETSKEEDGKISFTFPDGTTCKEAILESAPPKIFAFTYFGGVVKVTLRDDGASGTDLDLRVEGSRYPAEELPGWVSVLLALKAAADFGVDLRNHDPKRAWEQRYCDN